MQIFKLNIENYRGIKKFEQSFFDSKFVCFVGRGDSGKTTLLNAIYAVLYPGKWITFEDTDFYKGDIEKKIEITVTIGNFSDDLFELLCNDETYGGFLQRWDTETLEAKEIWIENGDVEKSLCCLKIRLQVDRYLEPTWVVVSSNETDVRPVFARDRALLNAFLIEDSQDSHFSLGSGTPLLNLYSGSSKQFKDDSVLRDLYRDLQKQINEKTNDIFDEKFLLFCKSLAQGLSKYNANITGEIGPTVSTKGIKVGTGSIVSISDELGSFSSKGKGTKRLTSIGIQSKIANNITLVDEIESGLEPDRVKSLVGTLKLDIVSKESAIKQVFATTHSRDVVVECDCTDIYIVRNTAGLVSSEKVADKHQAAVRVNPEVLFAKKILVCEGETEIGLVRSLEKFTLKRDGKKLSYRGVAVANGRGNNQTEYSQSYKELGYDVCQFCDSDEKVVNSKKEGLRTLGVEVIDWKDDFALEQIFTTELPWNQIVKALKIAVEYKGKQSIYDSIKNNYTETLAENFDEWTESPELRALIGLKMKDCGWFKQITQGEKLGDLVFEVYENLPVESDIKTKIESLIAWCDK